MTEVKGNKLKRGRCLAVFLLVYVCVCIRYMCAASNDLTRGIYTYFFVIHASLSIIYIFIHLHTRYIRLSNSFVRVSCVGIFCVWCCDRSADVPWVLSPDRPSVTPEANTPSLAQGRHPPLAGGLINKWQDGGVAQNFKKHRLRISTHRELLYTQERHTGFLLVTSKALREC